MRNPALILVLLTLCRGVLPAQPSLVNTNIDAASFLTLSANAMNLREHRRLTEAQFIAWSREPGVIVLDARSREMFDLLHVKGAVNLSFPDITMESLARVLPDKGQRILIYCNNNFRNEPRAFASKTPAASLNLSTFVSLYTYGYTNVYELGPLLDIRQTRIEFERANAKSP